MYGTVKIGNQVWMAQNMSVKTPSDFWCYRDKENNCKKYGALYSWAGAMVDLPKFTGTIMVKE